MPSSSVAPCAVTTCVPGSSSDETRSRVFGSTSSLATIPERYGGEPVKSDECPAAVSVTAWA